jgi:hypothetical protein
MDSLATASLTCSSRLDHHRAVCVASCHDGASSVQFGSVQGYDDSACADAFAAAALGACRSQISDARKFERARSLRAHAAIQPNVHWGGPLPTHLRGCLLIFAWPQQGLNSLWSLTDSCHTRLSGHVKLIELYPCCDKYMH